jgi:hypothetical protein
LAQASAAALRAEFVAIEVASVDGRLVVWDVQPTPEYRSMRPLTARSVDMALRDLLVGGADSTEFESGLQVAALITRREALDGAVLSA